MIDEPKTHNDPETYHRCSAPRSPEEAKADADAFLAAVAELRVEHRIANLVVIAEVPTTGETASYSPVMFRGDHRIILHLVQALWSGLVDRTGTGKLRGKARGR